MAEYPTNSSLNLGSPNNGAPQTPPVKVESVVSGKVKKKNKKLRNFILAQDFRDIREGVIDDIVRPGMKDIIYNIFQKTQNWIDAGFQMMLWGDYKKNPNQKGDKVSYNQYSNGARRPSSSPSMTSTLSDIGLIYESRGDAEGVLKSMIEHLDEFPFVTVAQMYEFSDQGYNNYMYNNYGWTDLTGVRVKGSFDGGYIIDLPRAKPLNLQV